MIGGGEAVPLVDAPTIADIYRLQCARPWWQQREPIEVEPDVWQAAKREIDEIMERRGWPVLSDEAMSRKGRANFLLFGVPVVMHDASH